MARKSTPTPIQKETPAWKTEIKGLFLLIAVLLTVLSYAGFNPQTVGNNWVGVIGQTVGGFLHFTFGTGSYLLSAYLTWIGWSLLLNHTARITRAKTFFFSIFLISYCILINLIEFQMLNGEKFHQVFNQALAHSHWKFTYHLGGVPFYYLYREIPHFNLASLLNTVGTAILFSSTLIISFFLLIETSLKEWIFHFAKKLFSKNEKEEAQILTGQVSEEKPSTPLVPPKHSVMRFVKLKTAELNQEFDIAPPVDLLAIQPDIDLYARPSISRKIQTSQKYTPPEPPQEFSEPTPVIPKTLVASVSPSQPSKIVTLTPSDPETHTKSKSSKPPKASPSAAAGDFSSYKLPPVSLLTEPTKIDQTALKKGLRRQAEVLEETLMSFGIEAKVGQINCGPTITSFEVHPAVGVKVQKIKTLENDIALNMEARSIRIIAPIPGKAAVGIEVPNPQPQEVGFKEILTTYQKSATKLRIPMLFGKAVNGDFVMNDLTKMPHCIIAGATGSGKSVCINTIIMSILMNARPDQIRLLMVDPKKVELTPYSNLPHMLAPVITEPQEAYAALCWLVKEMEERYEMLKLVGVRNVDGFNSRKIDEQLEAEAGDKLKKRIPPFMPYMVAFVDELADLMMASTQNIEIPITRIAQMARAVGIHLIIATQRPSREVITGLIKANFPARISFKVASRVNSQIVLDETGAEALLGNGDMLLLPPGSSHLLRAQGAYIRDEDINKVITFICDQAPPNYVTTSFSTMGSDLSDSGGGRRESGSGDALYDEAYNIILKTNNASTTFLQRKLKIGYARAAALMDQLEAHGVIGAADGSKPRRILVKGYSLAEED